MRLSPKHLGRALKFCCSLIPSLSGNRLTMAPKEPSKAFFKILLKKSTPSTMKEERGAQASVSPPLHRQKPQRSGVFQLLPRNDSGGTYLVWEEALEPSSLGLMTRRKIRRKLDCSARSQRWLRRWGMCAIHKQENVSLMGRLVRFSTGRKKENVGRCVALLKQCLKV